MTVAQAHYAGAVPLDQLKSEQDRIALELPGPREVLSTKRLHRDQLERTVEQAWLSWHTPGSSTSKQPGAIRRQLNQSRFERSWLADDEVIAGDMTHLFRRLLDTQLEQQLLEEAPIEPEAQGAAPIAEATQQATVPYVLDFLKRIERAQGE